MRPRLLLYLSRDGEARDAAALPTLAAIACGAGAAFDAYREGRRGGTHHGGGDPRVQPRPALLGGTLIGSRHLEAARALCARFDVTCARLGPSLLEPHLVSHGARTIGGFDGLAALYRAAAAALGTEPPRSAVLLGSGDSAGFPEIEYYAAPLLLERGDAVFPAGDPDAAEWNPGAPPAAIYLARSSEAAGEGIESIVPIDPADDYASITTRLLRARRSPPASVLLGDPPLVAHSVPLLLKEDWAPLFGIPQGPLIDSLVDELPPGSVARGRVFEDDDFFRLSRRGVSLEVLDPDRPPFAACGGEPSGWSGTAESAGVAQSAGVQEEEPSEAQLERWAETDTVLVSLAFWAGAVREIETLYALFELIALTGLRCGVALTSGSLRLGGGLVSLISAPVSGGGVAPLVEPLLGCAGDGIAVESLMPPEALAQHLRAAVAEFECLAPPEWRPTGWWVTMDAQLVARPRARRPGRIAWRERGAGAEGPPFRIRYAKSGRVPDGSGATLLRSAQYDPAGPASTASARSSLRAKLRDAGLDRWFEAWRPFEMLMPGEIPDGTWEAARQAGLSYVMTKARFEDGPTLLRGPGDLVGINHTAGRWDGWTPFETVNRVSDLEQAERRLLARGVPGWLLSSVDTCLWTFSGELWARGAELNRIARFCAGGGRSGRLVPAKPGTIARYARVCARVGRLRETPWRTGAVEAAGGAR
jgi:hypothetical protein